MKKPSSKNTIRERNYKNPPVVEALCEIHFIGSKWDETIPGEFWQRIQGEFPKKMESLDHAAQFNIQGDGSATAGVSSLSRLHFINPSKSRRVQLQKDLLVVNQMAPYPKFNDWAPNLFETLALYKKLARPEGIGKVGLRYLNKIEIPEENPDLSKFFTLYPRVPEMVSLNKTQFLMRLEIPGLEDKQRVLITISSTPPTSKGFPVLLLDLFFFMNFENSGKFPPLRKIVNQGNKFLVRVFEGIITEKLRNQFQEEEKP